MWGTAASVSTLLTVVGRPNAPACAGNGGLMRGFPRLPSRALSIAVSSPQMYAPAPRCTTMSMSTPLPKMFLPAALLAYASRSASSSTGKTSVNSPRTKM